MRPFLVWRDDWLLGHELLDEQHLLLANTLNNMHSFLASDGGKPRVGMDQLLERLSQLLEMNRRHFQDEECLMQECGYPRLSAHHREHSMLLAEMQECIREIESGRRPFSVDTLTALKHWIIDHVLNSDRHFAEYLARKPAPSLEPAAESELTDRPARSCARRA